MFKVNNRNTRTRCEICSELTIKTPAVRCLISVAFCGAVLIRGKHSFQDGAYLDLSVYRENKVKGTWELEPKEIFSRYYEESTKMIQHSSVNILTFRKMSKKKEILKSWNEMKKVSREKNYFVILTFTEYGNCQLTRYNTLGDKIFF